MALKDPSQLELLKKKKGRKFGNKPVIIDGIKFDSKSEGARYLMLCQAQAAGSIRSFGVKPTYRFKSGIKFIPDFQYIRCVTNQPVVEDIKGAKVTATFRMKCKLLKAEYGLEVEIVRLKSAAVNDLLAAFASRVRQP